MVQYLKVNFGLELELDQVNHNEVCKLFKKEICTNWIVKEDKARTKFLNA